MDEAIEKSLTDRERSVYLMGFTNGYEACVERWRKAADAERKRVDDALVHCSDIVIFSDTRRAKGAA